MKLGSGFSRRPGVFRFTSLGPGTETSLGISEGTKNYSSGIHSITDGFPKKNLFVFVGRSLDKFCSGSGSGYGRQLFVPANLHAMTSSPAARGCLPTAQTRKTTALSIESRVLVWPKAPADTHCSPESNEWCHVQTHRSCGCTATRPELKEKAWKHRHSRLRSPLHFAAVAERVESLVCFVSSGLRLNKRLVPPLPFNRALELARWSSRHLELGAETGGGV